MPTIIENRRNLHQIPEIELTTQKTAQYIENILDLYDCKIDHPIPNSVTAYFDNKKENTIVFRSDMDALPMEENTDLEFKSTNGCMHACGHDAHTSVGLAVAKWLTDHKDELSGTIRLIYQPAEEGARGAAAMAAKGIVDDVDNFIGAHIGSRAKLGELLIATGGLFASSKIDVSFTGEAAHAGADPEKGRNALLAACDAALLIAAIPRHSAGESRVNVGQLSLIHI